MFHQDGSPKNINEMDENTRACIGGIEINELYEGKGKDRKFIGYAKKYKIWDKNSALEKAMKHLGLLIERRENIWSGGTPFTDELPESIKKMVEEVTGKKVENLTEKKVMPAKT
jgi:hypothetical protein